jgi:hypothetical protein
MTSAPLLPGEAVLVWGLARTRGPLPGLGEVATQVVVTLTSARVLVAPESRLGGVLAVPWNAVVEVAVPQPLLAGAFRHYLDLIIEPNHALRFVFAPESKGVATQREFFDRAGAIAIERSTATRGLGPPTPRFTVLARSAAG